MAKVVAIASLFVLANVGFFSPPNPDELGKLNSDYLSSGNHSVLFKRYESSASARGQNVSIFLRQSVHVSVPDDLNRTSRLKKLLEPTPRPI